MRRVGRHAGLEQRQGRHQRHFLLRDEPVERGRAQAAAPRRAVHLGRLVRLLPRALPPRRHPVRFSEQLASAPGGERAARRRRPRRQERGDRRAGRRTRDAAQRGARQELRRHAGRSEAPPAARRLLRRAHRRFRADRGALAVGRQLGRHGPAHARQFRRLAARRLPAEMAGGARRYPLHAFLQQLRRSFAEAFLRPLPQGRGHRLEQAAARVAQHPPSGREIRAARRERVAARAHAMDEIFPAARWAKPRPRHTHGRDDAEL